MEVPIEYHSGNKPEEPGMYIVVNKLTDADGYEHLIHALRSFNDDKWSCENLGVSNIVAWAGPFPQFKEKK